MPGWEHPSELRHPNFRLSTRHKKMGTGGIGDGQNWAFIIEISYKIGDDLVRHLLKNHTDRGRLGADMP
eukprot:231287-Chlamydomonas_euryale.AAC.1